MATPHNKAEVGQIAKTVLMPGDPLRAKFIAETFLTDVKQFNDVRNMYGFTGTYNGVEVSVMGSGMGMPSIGIYSYELYTQYGVENIIRIGSAGSYCEEAKVYDVVLASEAYSESSYANTQSGYDKDKTYPNKELNDTIKECANKLNIPVIEGCIHSSDVFYREGGTDYKTLHNEKGCLAVEMESFALFHNASVLGKKAACLLTISDSFVSNEVTTAEERQTSFTNMMKVALEAAIIL
ncbi:MAG: purine-nucleoside phosphorylase [Lachnospiraceae bacterium]|nr:purine-nucleoside phosphorylase [Lachnospiraceae bacterium]